MGDPAREPGADRAVDLSATPIIAAAAAFVVSCLGTRALIALLRREDVLDIPNERSSHAIPTPRGGGLAVAGAIAAAWIGLCATGAMPTAALVVVGAMAGLAAVSWIDDLHGLPAGPRLLAQVGAVSAGIVVLPQGAIFQHWLLPGLDAVAAALLWVWFVNLFNFMDGIDGIAGAEAIAIGLGLALIASGDPTVAAPAMIIAAAALGFLVWNWAPARIFLGDVGSVSLGYLLGYLLLAEAARGEWRVALILPLYFLADATLTLLRRLLRRQRVWQAHREHFYQRAVQNGLGHAAVVLRVLAADAVLIACVWAAVLGWGFAALTAAAAVVVLLLVELGRARS